MRRLRREPLVELEGWHGDDGAADGWRRRLPHEGSMRLIDEVVGIDESQEVVVARRQVGLDHLGLDGHFPGDPVLPGTLIVEMLGQAGVVLFSYLLEEKLQEPVSSIRATKILGAHFTAPVRPPMMLRLVVQAEDYDGFLGHCRAQALADGQVVAAMRGEVMAL